MAPRRRPKVCMAWRRARFPFLKSIPPERFLKGLAAGEVVTGALLLAPFVPNAVAGAVLTGFSGSLLAMYARTPALRKPGSVWPSQVGIAVSKDVWMLGIGLGLLADATRRRGRDAGYRLVGLGSDPPSPESQFHDRAARAG